MLRRFVNLVTCLILGSSLLVGGNASAQTMGASDVFPSTAAPVVASDVKPGAPPPDFVGAVSDFTPSAWFNIDYLAWWIREAPAPGPLLTTGSIFGEHPLAIGQPTTRVLIGDRAIGDNFFNGVRLAAGAWIDTDRSIGYEASGFALEHRTDSQSFSADATGVPFIARPIFNVPNNVEGAITLSVPGIQSGPFQFPAFQTGGLTASSSTRVSGWDFNVVVNGAASGAFRADALFGFRALYLNENLTIRDSVTALVDLFNLNAGERMNTQDRFGASNNFYGGQFGGRLNWSSDRWIATAVAKLGLGVTDELVVLEGLATSPGKVVDSGTLIYPGNAGRYFHNDFAVVPEFNLNVAYRVSKVVTLRAGYTFIYWNEVVRPSEMVSRRVDLNLNPNYPSPFPPSTNAPRAVINTSDFWTQGLNLGVEFRF